MNAKTIAAKQFARGAFGTYKADDVDAFFGQVVAYVKQLEKESEEQLHNMKLLADKIEEYRASEGAVQEALVKAQKYGNKIINDAKLEAEEISNAAKAQAADTMTIAQEKAFAISNEAMEQTELLIRELKNKALTDLNELKQKTAIERKTMEHARAAASVFKADLFELYRAHLDLINRIPDLSETDYVPDVLPQEDEIAVNEPTIAALEEVLMEEAPEAAKEEAFAAEVAPEETKEEVKDEVKEEQLDFAKIAETNEIPVVEEPTITVESDGDTKVIPVEEIDGDTTPDDVRRTMQNTAKPVYGRKFTDLKFGSK